MLHKGCLSTVTAVGKQHVHTPLLIYLCLFQKMRHVKLDDDDDDDFPHDDPMMPDDPMMMMTDDDDDDDDAQ